MRLWKIIIFIVPVLMFGCDAEKELPSRDEIPHLRQRLYEIEQAIANYNRAGLDSLLAYEILDHGQSSDSLFSFVFGPEKDFDFVKLGDYQIFYNKEISIIDCFIMDSLENKNRPLKLYLKYDAGVWLLNKFEEGSAESDSDSEEGSY